MENKFDNQHIKNVHKYADDVSRLYDEAIQAAARLLGGADYDPKGFNINKYPQIKSKFNKFFNNFSGSLDNVIRNGVREEWHFANKKNDALVKSILGDDAQKKYFNSNGKALDAFLTRKTDGLDLSDRVWIQSKSLASRFESAVASGIGSGHGAALIAKDLTDYLQTPAQVGPGVYSDPKKNAQRLTRTETNMVYHASDYERWQQMDFVIGFEVEVSNNGKVCPLCLQLQGKYPKWFKFVGWHPHCFCHATAILAEDIDKVENDPNEVTQVPLGFAKWANDNQERSIGKKQPYFVRDNFKGGKLTGGLLKPESMPKAQVTPKGFKVGPAATNAELNKEMSRIAEAHPEYFARGYKEIKTDKRMTMNGGTDMNGMIMLNLDRLVHVREGFSNISRGVPTTVLQEDALSTLWHEITHNRNKLGNIRMTDLETKAMELTNEYVSRNTLADFMTSIGGKLQNKTLMTSRESTGYNRMVMNLQATVKHFDIDKKAFLGDVMIDLFEGSYKQQKNLLAKRLIDYTKASPSKANILMSKIIRGSGADVEEYLKSL